MKICGPIFPIFRSDQSCKNKMPECTRILGTKNTSEGSEWGSDLQERSAQRSSFGFITSGGSETKDISSAHSRSSLGVASAHSATSGSSTPEEGALLSTESPAVLTMYPQDKAPLLSGHWALLTQDSPSKAWQAQAWPSQKGFISGLLVLAIWGRLQLRGGGFVPTWDPRSQLHFVSTLLKHQP